ncbi:MAG: ribulose-phosphate 3-epimerase [Clostridiaceae bacterium]|nr:ribulose-phosphate 3-epimerase [Clostridiaceae bacterium]
MIKIAPSILASDFSRLGEEIKKVEDAGADMIHVDVMDGHFVPNITIGPPVVKCLRSVTKLPLDVHLMITGPDKYINDFADAGADILCVHVECCWHLNRTIQAIKQRGIKAAVALNPATSLSTLDWVLQDVDMVLIMTVNPGFGGQAYIESCTEKIRQLRRIVNERYLHIDIEVDGGIGLDNIRKVTEAGANVIVAGSTIYNAPDTKKIIADLRKFAFNKNV